jgi:hypothetical protein
MTKQRIHFGLGITSILVIFVILCIVTFSVLSYVSAKADSSLSSKVSENTADYYNACSRANEKLAVIDEKLSSIADAYGNQAAYFAAAEEYFASDPSYQQSYSKENLAVVFTEDLSASQVLHVTVQILYPGGSNPWYYKITGWETENVAEWNPDNSVHVIGG